MKIFFILLSVLLMFTSCEVENNEDLCKNVDCSSKANSTCVEGICKCVSGYHEDGNNCVINENDPCKNVDCSSKANSTCIEGICKCVSGYYEDGNNCVINALPISKTFQLGNLTLNENETVDLLKTVLIMQSDGNLVLYKKEPTQALWATSTNCSAGYNCNQKFNFQNDGNLVVLDNTNSSIYSSGTNGIGVHHLTIDDTKLGLYDANNHLIWSSTCTNGDLVNAECNLYNPCDDLTCGIHSSCHLNGNIAECKCDNGYENLNANNNCTEIDKCDGVNCINNASCNSDDGICYCDNNYHISSDNRSCIANNICDSLSCGSHSSCNYDMGVCSCDNGYHEDASSNCIENDQNACGGCSGHGTCYIKENNDPVCACDTGYTAGDRTGLTCVLTSTVCKGGAINYDVDGDGVNENWFEPSTEECDMFELLNFIRAVHDKEGSPESHKPLLYDVLWSAHARNHSKLMAEQGGLYHDDYPGGQNCAYNSRGSSYHMSQYMGCSNPKEPICKSSGEGHCNVLSHHCNIMRPSFSHVGIGLYNNSWGTQNFY